jgi:hypothetical protein
MSERREQPEQLDLEVAIAEQEEGFAGWDVFASPTDDEEEPSSTTGPVFLTQRRATAPSPLFPLLKSAEGRSDVTEPGRA